MAAEAKKKGNQTAKAGKGPEQKEKTTAKKNSKASGTGTKKEASRKGGQKEQKAPPDRGCGRRVADPAGVSGF